MVISGQNSRTLFDELSTYTSSAATYDFHKLIVASSWQRFKYLHLTAIHSAIMQELTDAFPLQKRTHHNVTL